MNKLNKEAVIEMVAVQSEAFKAIGYDGETETLRLVFDNGEAYRYAPVGQEIFQALNIAPSLGKGFHKEVRENKTLDFFCESDK